MTKKPLHFLSWTLPLFILVVVEIIMLCDDAKSRYRTCDNDMSRIVGIACYEAAFEQFNREENLSAKDLGTIFAKAAMDYSLSTYESRTMREYLAKNLNDKLSFSKEYFDLFISKLNLNLEKNRYNPEYVIKLISSQGGKETILFESDKKDTFSPFPWNHYKTTVNTDSTIWYDSSICIYGSVLSAISGSIILCIIIDILACGILYLYYNAYKKKRQIESFQNTFKNMIIHDMRSPLSVAIATDELLEQNEFIAKDEKATKLLEISKKNLLELDSQISSTLGYVNSTSYIHQDEIEAIGLNDFIGNLFDSYRITHPDAIFNKDIPSSLQVLATREALIAIFRNIIDNSLKYSDKAPVIAINATNRGLNHKAGMQDIIIQDNGIGIDKESLEHIYEEGFRGKTSKETIKGFGLGLYVVYKAITGLGWKINIDSVPGKGTRITITAKITKYTNSYEA